MGDPQGQRDLTPREREVADALTDGLSRLDVAKRLGISYHTVNSHVKAILRKTGFRRTRKLAASRRRR